LTQLNEVLQTRETARGLVSRMPDVLFATNRATLRPDAKIKLAKVAGIIMAYPDLKLEIDGFTDSTGTAQYNEVLSNQRAAAVRDFLITQGVPVNNVIARGYGQSDPIASNATPQGRQQNRRVELVVSGNAIGTAIQPATTTSGEATSASGTTGNSTGTTGGVSGAAAQPAESGPTNATPGSAVGAPSGSASTTSTTTTTTTVPANTPPANSNTQPATSSPASSPSTAPPANNPNVPPTQ
jgi:hypothetical protein